MAKENQTYITVKDHSVSGEEFQLLYNSELELLETSPQPKGDNLSNYYKSEDYISHTDTRRNLFEKLYHFIRTIALKRKLSLINSFQNESKTLLDIGCGTGDFLQAALKDGWQITGIEPSSDARKIANKKTNNIVLEVEQLEKLNPNSFDVITLWHVLEHLPDLETHVRVFKHLLKPKGHLVIAVPNYKSYDAKYYKNFWAAFDVPRHLWHFSQESIKRLFINVDFKLEETHPMKFDAYYVSLLSEKYKSGLMNPLKGFWIGLRSNLKAKRTGEYSSLIYVLKNDLDTK